MASAVIGLIQRVKQAAVEVDGKQIAEIDHGIVLLMGVEQGDTKEFAERLIGRVIAYRIFADDSGRMNRSLADVEGGLMIVPQFTLAADTQKGLRPSFTHAAEPARGRELFDYALGYAQKYYAKVSSGLFGANMQVHLTNDGPVTFHLQIN